MKCSASLYLLLAEAFLQAVPGFQPFVSRAGASLCLSSVLKLKKFAVAKVDSE